MRGLYYGKLRELVEQAAQELVKDEDFTPTEARASAAESFIEELSDIMEEEE